MKNVVIKILAVALTVWYMMSIIGFDVHTCSDSGRSFITTFIEGLACEDIHPEHSCDETAYCTEEHHECCPGHAEDHSDCPFCDGVSLVAKSCCSNDYQVLALTGTSLSESQGQHDDCACGHCPYVGFPVRETLSSSCENKKIEYIPYPDSGVVSACDRQAALRVWRI